MRRLALLITIVATSAFSVAVPVAVARSGPASDSATARLQRYAATTWRSFTVMVDTDSGLPTD